MKIADIATTALARRQRPNLKLSLLDTPLLMARHRQPAPPRRPEKLMSVELELAGLAVEFKAKSLSGFIGWLSLGAVAVALLQELMRPRQFRTWHGRVARVIPYDFRKPTLRRFANSVWAPDNPSLFTDTALGVGWSLNLAQLPRVMMGLSRPSSGSASYAGPRVSSPNP